MKILLVHNYYRAQTPSGENTVFDAEARLLEQAGHEVERLVRSNDEIAASPLSTMLTASLLTGANPFAAAQLRRRLAEFRPDIVHFHNTFPLLSPALLPVARSGGAAVVATLHNYRMVCAQSGLFRQQQICTECLDRGAPWPALRHRCYRDSALATLPVALMIARHQRQQTWSGAAHALIVLTAFQKGLMQRTGISADLLQVKPNFAAATTSLPWTERDDTALFLGRVCDEKGIWTLLEAWRQLGSAAPRLRIIGAGPALPAAQRYVAETGLGRRVDLPGALPHAQAMTELARARLLVYPSQWYEPFGMSIVEAYARSVPVLASRLGSLPDLVRDGDSGALFEAGNAAALAAQVQRLWQQPAELAALAAGAQQQWQQHYNPAANLVRLEAIYHHALDRRQTPGAPGPLA